MGPVELNPIKARFLCPFNGPDEILDDLLDLILRECFRPLLSIDFVAQSG